MLKAQFKSTESIDLFDGSSISYLLIRKYRRSIGLRITKNGLIVNAPIFVSKNHIKKVIFSKEKWIKSKLNLIKIKVPLFSLKNCHEFNLLGEKVIFRVTEGENKIYLQNNSCFISFNSKKNNLFPNKVLLSNAKTKWGSCNSKKEVRLNWRLIQSSATIIDYVICHELSHLKFMDHSQQFWSLVGEIFPSYKETQKQLKLVGFQLYHLD